MGFISDLKNDCSMSQIQDFFIIRGKNLKPLNKISEIQLTYGQLSKDLADEGDSSQNYPVKSIGVDLLFLWLENVQLMKKKMPGSDLVTS